MCWVRDSGQIRSAASGSPEAKRPGAGWASGLVGEWGGGRAAEEGWEARMPGEPPGPESGKRDLAGCFRADRLHRAEGHAGQVRSRRGREASRQKRVMGALGG